MSKISQGNHNPVALKRICDIAVDKKKRKSIRYELTPFKYEKKVENSFEPVGELANIYKGCKIIKKKLAHFNLDVPLPKNWKGCKWLKGDDKLLDFVVEEKRISTTNSNSRREDAKRRKDTKDNSEKKKCNRDRKFNDWLIQRFSPKKT